MFEFVKKLEPRRKSILFTCFFAFFCNGSLTLVIGSVMPDLKNAWNLTDTFSGMLLSAHSAGNLIAGFISGLVPLYLGERRSIMTLSILAYIGLAMTMLSGSPLWLLAAFLLIGMGRGSVTNFNSRTVNRVTDGSPVASNTLHSCFAVGAILSPQIFLLLQKNVSWRVGLVPVICFGLISFSNFARMHMEEDRPDRKDKKNRSAAFLKNPSFLILMAMMFCYLCSEYAINGWLVTYIQNKPELLHAFTENGVLITERLSAYSQMMATLLWAVILVGRLICARLSRTVSQRTLMMISSFGVVLFFFLMLAGSTVTLVSFAVAGLGLMMAGICPMIYSDAAVFTNFYPLATSFLLAFGSFGAILMPTVVGSLAERFGFTGGMSAILLTTVLLSVFSVLNRFMKRRLPPGAAEEEQPG